MGWVYLVTSVVSCGVGVSQRPRGGPRDGAARDVANVSTPSEAGDVAQEATSDGAGIGGSAGGAGGMAGGLPATGAGGEAGAGSGATAMGAGGAATGGSGGISLSMDASVATDGGMADVAVDTTVHPEGGIDAPNAQSVCTAGFHSCGGRCVTTLSTDHCGGSACTPCPVPVGGTATCDGTACGVSCDADRHACGTTCVTADDPLACGPSCSRCPVDPNGNTQCLAGACNLQCRTGFHACGSRCADDMSPQSCGGSCEPCAAPVGGRAICVQGRCDMVCSGDQRLCHGVCIDDATACDGMCKTSNHRCGDVCRPNGSPDSCGTSCTPCPARAGGEATCDGSLCGFRCRTGFHACGADCPANGRSVACIGPRVTGNPNAYVDRTGQDAFVLVASDRHIVQVTRASAGGIATLDLTRASQATTTAAGDAWSYLRTDNAGAIVYRGNDNHIHEIAQQGSSWTDADFVGLAAAPAHPTATVMAYVRADLRNTLVYRSADNHIAEIASNFGDPHLSWLSGDLTTAGAGPEAGGNPMGYLRADGKDAVVYRAADGHLHELVSNFAHYPPPWIDTDLTEAAGQPAMALASDPWGYVRGDGRSAVAYRGTDGALHEVSMAGSGAWTDQILPAVAPTGTPMAFVRGNGRTAIVYRSTDTAAGSIHMLTFAGDWSDLSLDALDQPPSGPADNPFGRVTAQGLDAVLYRNTAGELAEHRLDIGGAWSAVTY